MRCMLIWLLLYTSLELLVWRLKPPAARSLGHPDLRFARKTFCSQLAMEELTSVRWCPELTCVVLVWWNGNRVSA